MSSPAAQSQTQRLTAPQASAPVRKRSINPKLVAGLGVSMTVAVVVAVTSLGGMPASNISPASSASAVALQTETSNLQTPRPVQTIPMRVTADAETSFVPLQAAPALPPSYAPAVAPPPPAQKQCSLPLRKFYVAGNGVIRIHAGDYVSPPVTLGPYAQEVVFPVSRPSPGTEAVDRIVVEGRASTVVMTSDLPGFRQVFNGLRGSSSFDARWAPLRNC
jgi:hypothetical protein